MARNSSIFLAEPTQLPGELKSNWEPFKTSRAVDEGKKKGSLSITPRLDINDISDPENCMARKGSFLPDELTQLQAFSCHFPARHRLLWRSKDLGLNRELRTGRTHSISRRVSCSSSIGSGWGLREGIDNALILPPPNR